MAVRSLEVPIHSIESLISPLKRGLLLISRLAPSLHTEVWPLSIAKATTPADNLNALRRFITPEDIKSQKEAKTVSSSKSNSLARADYQRPFNFGQLNSGDSSYHGKEDYRGVYIVGALKPNRVEPRDFKDLPAPVQKSLIQASK